MSLFDFGIFRLNKYFDLVFSDPVLIGTSVGIGDKDNAMFIDSDEYARNRLDVGGNSVKYDQERNKILFNSMIFIKEPSFSLKENYNLLCTSAIKIAKERLILDESRANYFFSHSGYTEGNRPKSIGANLLKHMEISIFMNHFVSGDNAKCSSAILEEDTYVTDKRFK